MNEAVMTLKVVQPESDIGTLANALAIAKANRQKAMTDLAEVEVILATAKETERTALKAFNDGIAALRPKRPRKPKEAVQS